jgi:DNA-binding LacI/PurR family transcriptional regulator
MTADVTRRTGIRDVAQAAGVSISTVSRALSGKGRIPDATRARIRSLADELGYTPHPAARSLASGRTGLVATVVSLPGNAPLAFTEIDYYVELTSAATRAALERGYALVLAPSTAGPETWSRLPLDGVIVIDPADGDPALAILRGRGLPIVFVGRDLNGRPDDLVVQNDRGAAMREMLDHLHEAGGGDVAVLTLRTFESFTDESIAAYRAWCEARQQAPVVHAADIDSTAGVGAFRDAVAAFLSRGDRPRAVVCLYERLAVELLGAARAAGVRVPRDLAVATISEMGMAESTEPALTTLEVNQDLLGELAGGLLIDALEGRSVASVTDVPTTLVVRGSSARGTPRRSAAERRPAPYDADLKDGTRRNGP